MYLDLLNNINKLGEYNLIHEFNKTTPSLTTITNNSKKYKSMQVIHQVKTMTINNKPSPQIVCYNNNSTLPQLLF